MKIALASDLHLEFSDINLTNDNAADVLILSGDIMVAQDLYDYPAMNGNSCQPVVLGSLGNRAKAALRYREFLKRCSSQFPYVIYVAGNHEFYHGKFVGGLQVLQDECSVFPNVFFLEDDIKKIGDVTFIGSTLWTDMNKGDPITLHVVSDVMNDFKVIRHDAFDYTKLRPAHVMSRHRKSVEYIKNVVALNKKEKIIIVSHHAPSKKSTHSRYDNDTLLNGAYSSDLSELMLENPQIKLWTHGHTHHSFDYCIGDTRVLCNPRGYVGYELQADEFQLMCVTV